MLEWERLFHARYPWLRRYVEYFTARVIGAATNMFMSARGETTQNKPSDIRH